MNSQNAKQLQKVVILGIVLLILGLFLAIRYAFLCHDDIDIHQLSDLGFVIVGVSIQLLGLGLIIIGKK